MFFVLSWEQLRSHCYATRLYKQPRCVQTQVLPKFLQLFLLCTSPDNINDVDAQVLCKRCDHATEGGASCSLHHVLTLWRPAGVYKTLCSHGVDLPGTQNLRTAGSAEDMHSPSAQVACSKTCFKPKILMYSCTDDVLLRCCLKQ